MSEAKSEILGRCDSRVCNRSVERWFHAHTGWCQNWTPLKSETVHTEAAKETVTITLNDILHDVPPGAWAAVYKYKVVAFGADMQQVLVEARKQGVKEPLIVKVPSQSAILFIKSSESETVEERAKMGVRITPESDARMNYVVKEINKLAGPREELHEQAKTYWREWIEEACDDWPSIVPISLMFDFAAAFASSLLQGEGTEDQGIGG